MVWTGWLAHTVQTYRLDIINTCQVLIKLSTIRTCNTYIADHSIGGARYTDKGLCIADTTARSSNEQDMQQI
jgi:hypothetical protein